MLVFCCRLRAWPADDKALDALPIGLSPQRLELAVLPAGQVMATAAGQEVDLPALVRQNLDKDVFIIGEYHDSYACHVWQKDFIEALAKEYPRLVVGFEFFNRGDDPALDLYLSGKIGEAELLQKTGWYQRGALNFAYTRLVLETVKKLGLKAVGLNVPRELVSRVAKGGFAKLSAAEQAMFPGVEPHLSRTRILRPQHAGRIRRAGAALVPERLCRPEVLGHGHGRIHAPGPGAPGIPRLQGDHHRRQRPRGLRPGHSLALPPARQAGQDPDPGAGDGRGQEKAKAARKRIPWSRPWPGR